MQWQLKAMEHRRILDRTDLRTILKSWVKILDLYIVCLSDPSLSEYSSPLT